MSKQKYIKVILKIAKRNIENLAAKKSLVNLAKLGAKFVLRIYQLGYMVLQPSFLMQMVLSIRQDYQRILRFHSLNVLNLFQVLQTC